MTRPTIRLLFGVFIAARTCLPSRCLATTGGIHIQTHRLMGGIYEVRRWDGVSCHDIYTNFHKDLFRHSKVDRGNTQTTGRSHKPTSRKSLKKLLRLPGIKHRSSIPSHSLWRRVFLIGIQAGTSQSFYTGSQGSTCLTQMQNSSLGHARR
jgi:hypothetical protein